MKTATVQDEIYGATEWGNHAGGIWRIIPLYTAYIQQTQFYVYINGTPDDLGDFAGKWSMLKLARSVVRSL